MFRLKKVNLLSVLLAALFVWLGSVLPALATGGAGEQSGSPGTPGQKPLNFLSASLVGGGAVDGTANIPLTPKFVLIFDKNVVNDAVWNTNRQCFSLTAGNGVAVPLNITKIDDTVDFTQRQKIFVAPVNSLTPGNSYRLSISPELVAKNLNSRLGGTTGGQGVTISFKTAGSAPAPVATPGSAGAPAAQNHPPAGSSDGIPPTRQANQPDQTGLSPDRTAGKSSAAAAKESATGKAPSAALLQTIIAVLVLGWIAVEIFLKYRKRP